MIYLRQSQDRLGTGLAVDRQREDCERLCRERGWHVVDILVDNDVSATSTAKRPAYEAVLALAAARRIDVIVAWHVDRITRKLTDLEALIALSETTGVKVATVSGDVDLTTDSGRLIGRILASVARGEIERKSSRQSRQSRQAAELGKPPDRRAFGYAPGGMEIDPAEAPAVRQAFSELLAGASLVSICKRLNNEGHQSTRKSQWEPSMARTMLTNPRYAAIRRYKGEEIGPGNWPPIVPEETYRAAAAILGDPVRRMNKVGGARKWVGAKLYRCGKCNDGTTVNSGSRSAGSRVYTCSALSHLQRSAEPIDEYVHAVVAEYLRRPDVASALTSAAPEVDGLRDEATALRARLDQLAGDYADGLLTGRQLHLATERITMRLDELETRLSTSARATGLGDVLAANDKASVFLAAPVGVRQAVIAALATVTILPGQVGKNDFDPRSVRIEWRSS